MNIAVFCSGRGSNFQAIADNIKKKKIRAKIALMVCDNPQAYDLERARIEKIKTLIIERKNFKSKEDYETEIIRRLEQENIGLICLAGYMRIVGSAIIKKYRDKIINIHPALLPAFKGAHAIKDALDCGARVTGVTVHFVDEEMDHGPIILQEALEVRQHDNEESLAKRIHKIEHKLYPQAVKLFVEGKLIISKQGVEIV